MAALTNFSDEIRIAFDTLSERVTTLNEPTLRIGVTGLSRAGKTVFISALVHNLLHGGSLPLFEPMKSGRITRAYLQPQPDDDVPRFAYEDHIDTMLSRGMWPQSTRAISQLRLTLEYQPTGVLNRWLSSGKLSIDIIDYPGEWLLDLPLLGKNYNQFSTEAIEMARMSGRADLSEKWLAQTSDIDGNAPEDETIARRLNSSFCEYLQSCRAQERALSTLPPGRFLMPGDLEGSPALTFAPLFNTQAKNAKSGTLHAMMERRYEAYKTHVVKPFFRDHITRLDRQIVLIDAMQSMNAGSHAVHDLERALREIMVCFRQGTSNPLTALISRRIDRILVAATKTDHIHHESHDKLQALVSALVERACEKARYSGAMVESMAIAAVRSTTQGTVKQGGETLPVIIGTPMQGETIDGQTFDGTTEVAVFPGDLPKNPRHILNSITEELPSNVLADLTTRFVRFRPPELDQDGKGNTLSLPHIRLDRAMQFLLGDMLS